MMMLLKIFAMLNEVIIWVIHILMVLWLIENFLIVESLTTPNDLELSFMRDLLLFAIFAKIASLSSIFIANLGDLNKQLILLLIY